MEQFFQMLDIQLALMIYILVGVICYKFKIITDKNRQQFIDFILIILMPCMVFNSFKNVTIEMLQQGVYALIISLIVCVITTYTGRILYKKSTNDRKSIMQYGTLINNAGFAGLPVVESMFGDHGLILASIFLIPIRNFMWSAGVTMLSEKKKTLKSITIKLMKNPSIIAVFIGLFRGLLEIRLPTFIDSSIGSMSAAVSPMAMIAIGSIIATTRVKGLFDKEIVYFTIIRLLLIPVCTLIVLKLIGLDTVLIGVSTILTAMPAATTTALLAAQYKSDVIFASKLVFVTTILSIFTSPLLMVFI